MSGEGIAEGLGPEYETLFPGGRVGVASGTIGDGCAGSGIIGSTSGKVVSTSGSGKFVGMSGRPQI